MSIQIPFVEILTILANRPMKVDQICNPIEFLLKVSPEMGTIEICSLIEHEDDEASRKDSVFTFKMVPDKRDSPDQNVAFRVPQLGFINAETFDGSLMVYFNSPKYFEQKIKKKSRKPGPNLRPF